MGYKLQVGDIIEDFRTPLKWEVHEVTECGNMVILKPIVGRHAGEILDTHPHYRDWDNFFLSGYGRDYTLRKSKSSNFNSLYEKLNDNN